MIILILIKDKFKSSRIAFLFKLQSLLYLLNANCASINTTSFEAN